MRARLGRLAACVVCLHLAGAAHAATLKNKRIGNWIAGAYSDEVTGGFSHCAAASNYRGGIALVFAINKRFAWSVGFNSSKWDLRKGDRYPISLRVDGAPAFSETAIAVTNHLAEVQLADSTALFDAFKHGSMLTVYAAGQTFRFDLTSTSTLLPSLLDCVRAFDKREQPPGSNNPFIPNAKPRAPNGKPGKKPGEIDVEAIPVPAASAG